jgi:hypothetical protein
MTSKMVDNIAKFNNLIACSHVTRLRWVRHVACLGKGQIHRALVKKTQKGRNHLEDLGIDGKIILK